MTTICKIIFWGAVGWIICYLAIGSIAAAIRSAQLSRRLRRTKEEESAKVAKQAHGQLSEFAFYPDDLYALNSEPVIVETEDPPVEGDSEATEQAVDRVLKTLDKPPIKLSPEELREIERDSL